MKKAMTIVAAATLAFASAGPAFAEIKRLEITAPAAAGGGYDQNARIMQQVMQKEKLASGVQVVNQPGAGGTIGLANYVNNKKRTPALMTGGLALVGAIITNKSTVTFDDTYPLARLTADYQPIIVAADSPYKSLEDLIVKLKADPGSISWGGSGPGSTDHMLYGLLAKAAGVEPSKINYVVLTSGGEMLSGVMGGHVTVGTGGYSELSAQIKSGKVRALAISSQERLEGIDIPTFKEMGFDVDLVNWRAVFAPKDITAEDKQEFEQAIDKMVKSEDWKAAVKQRGWSDAYMPAAEFGPFVKQEHMRAEDLFKELGLLK